MTRATTFLFLGGLAVGLFFLAKSGFNIVVGKRYRVTSLLRGADTAIVDAGLKGFGAEDILFTTDRVIYTITATRTKTIKLGVDKFTFNDTSMTVYLIVDAVQDA